MLWRALKHVDVGFYIDVGANDPETDSVTKAFYELGWRGLNIEPVPQWFEKLQESRVRDINLQLAVGSQLGEITLYEIPDTGLSTANKTFAEEHESEQGYQSVALTVPVETLSNICEQFHTSPIHFLKVDVEGMEKAVLEGLDYTKVRPWIILVESTKPNSQVECYQEWEYILLNAGYKFVYSDGLNRFYVADEQEKLMEAFQYPPNVFDDFVLKRYQDAEKRAEKAQTCADEAEKKFLDAQVSIEQCQHHYKSVEMQVEQLEKLLNEKNWELAAEQKKFQQLEDHGKWLQSELDASKVKIDESNRELQSIYNSKSWRITWPLRKLTTILKHLVKIVVQLIGGLFRLPKRVARLLLTKIMRFVLRHPHLKQRATRWLYRHRKLEAKLRAFAHARGVFYRPFPSIDKEANKKNQTHKIPLKWSSPERRLEVDELMARIRNELVDQKANQGVLPDE